MEFFELVERRHSVRSFTGEPVEQAAITRILKAALSAPSAKNTRSSSFMVVEEPELIGRIARMRDYGSAFVEKAPLVILVMGDQVRSDLWDFHFDVGIIHFHTPPYRLPMYSSLRRHWNWAVVGYMSPDGRNAERSPAAPPQRIICVRSCRYRRAGVFCVQWR